MKVSSIKCQLKQIISTMVIRGSYMFEFSVSKDMKNNIAGIKGEFQHIF